MYLYFQDNDLVLVSKDINKDIDLEFIEVPSDFNYKKTFNSELVDLTKEDVLKLLDYSFLRSIDYAKLNQNELRFNDEINGTTTWIDSINAIKEKYPKPL